MFGSAILEVAIGVVFVFILVSIICSAVREGLESLLKTRAAYLEHGIRELLQDRGGADLAKALFEHPLISNLFGGDYRGRAKTSKWRMMGGNLPSYIPSKNFAAALLDLAARGVSDDAAAMESAPPVSLDAIRSNVAALGNRPIARVLLHAIDTAQGDINKAQKNIEAWYDSTMDRVSGWYKRSTQWILFAIGLLIAGLLNVNTIAIGEYLYWNSAAREAVVNIAETSADAPPPDYTAAKASLESLHLPLGWKDYRYVDFWNSAALPFLGWLLTALAAAMGAPFWFDVLNKITVIRSTVKPHEKSPEEGSEDRQAKQNTAAITALQPIFAGMPAAAFGGAAVNDDRDVDNAGLGGEAPTSDEQLPAARGGVS